MVGLVTTSSFQYAIENCVVMLCLSVAPAVKWYKKRCPSLRYIYLSVVLMWKVSNKLCFLHTCKRAQILWLLVDQHHKWLDHMVSTQLPDTFRCFCSNYCNSMSKRRIECCLLTFWSGSLGIMTWFEHFPMFNENNMFFRLYYKIFWTVGIRRCWTCTQLRNKYRTPTLGYQKPLYIIREFVFIL